MDMKLDFNKIDAVLFDMDGTLVNTEPLHAHAMTKVLEDIGIELQLDLEEAILKYAGMTDTMVLQALYPEMNNEKINELIRQKNSKLVEIFGQLERARLEKLTSPGILDFIDWLKSNNKKMAVVSASEDIVVDATLKAFDLIHHFDFWIGRNQTPRTKPHPDPYLEAMRRMNVEAKSTLIFEDSDNGMASASSSGAICLRVAPFSSVSGLKNFIHLISDSF